MGVAAQIAKYGCWTRHCWLDIDDPVFPMKRLKKSPEGFRVFQWRGRAAEAEHVPAIRTLESLEKLASEDFLENTERKKEGKRTASTV